MGKIIALSVLMAIFTSVANAQEAQIPDEAIRELAKDLAKMNREVLKAQQLLREDIGVASQLSKAVITTGAAPVRLGASKSAAISFNAKEGEIFDVVDKVEGWYAIQKVEKAGWVNASDIVLRKTIRSYGESPAEELEMAMKKAGGESVPEQVFHSLTESAGRLRDAYKNNPYLFVKGFSVRMGLAPSVQLNFEFK